MCADSGLHDIQSWLRAGRGPGGSLLLVLLALQLPWPLITMQARGPLQDEWFGAFSEGESTVDTAVAGTGAVAGERPDGLEKHAGRSGAWYAETPSRGGERAWQTFYPAIQPTGQWRQSGDGHWLEDYRPARKDGWQERNSDWFDNSVNQFDRFGRRRAPDLNSRKHSHSVRERAVNTTLSCDTLGCSAFSLLQVFDPTVEAASHCMLSFYLHPTDFDDQYSGERLTWIRVNDQLVNSDCFPMISGCDATMRPLLYPCIQDLPVDALMDNGVLNISAQISDAVDECPYEGHLLAAVPLVTCLVSAKAGPAAAHRPALPIPASGSADEGARTLRAQAPLRCAERGCKAQAHLAPSAELAAQIGALNVTCLLQVELFQTDYDGEEGSLEQVEYLQIGEERVVSNITPGMNPCRSAWAGQPLTPEQKVFTVLRNVDVTRVFLEGKLSVRSKITPLVDECAHDGYLLDGMVWLNCDISPRHSARLPLMPQPKPEESEPEPVPVQAEPARPQAEQVPLHPEPVPRQASPWSSTQAPPHSSTQAPPYPDKAREEQVVSPGLIKTTPTPKRRFTVESSGVAPFGNEDVGEMLEEHSKRAQDLLVDAVELAQVTEVKRSVFRALTRLRAAQIKEFDTIARLESMSTDEFNDNHQFRRGNPLLHLHDNEPAVVADKYKSFHNMAAPL